MIRGLIGKEAIGGEQGRCGMDGKISILQDSEYSLYVRAVRDCEKSQARSHSRLAKTGEIWYNSRKTAVRLALMTG